MKKRTLLFLFLTVLSGCLLSGCGGEKKQETTEALESFMEDSGETSTKAVTSADGTVQFRSSTPKDELYDFGYRAADYVSIGNYKDIKVEKTEAEEVTEDAIREEIQGRMKKQGVWKEKTEGTVKQYDLVNMDINCTVDGQEYPAASREDTNINVGAGNFFPEFETQIIGKQIGENVTFTLTLPDNMQFSDKAGKEAEFTVHIKAVRTQQELTDETAAVLSNGKYSTVSDYEAYIKKVLSKEKQEEHNYTVFMEVMNQISDSIEIKEIPEEEKETGLTNEDIQKEAEEKGLSASELAQEYLSEGKSISTDNAEEASMDLVLLYIADQRGISVSGADISDYGTYLMDKGYTEEEIKQTYTERELAHLALNRMVMASVAENAES